MCECGYCQADKHPRWQGTIDRSDFLYDNYELIKELLMFRAEDELQHGKLDKERGTIAIVAALDSVIDG